ncbi:hypothetical protein GmarT_10550 [Gimesia maris]|uniref:Uncharacterized protein n=1 Tax=Gimesia maris TaxID=122 RepID=A0ABX5YHK7_9PLAN|nr:hypothetical protein GmarT_10550 [Gimesia maris]
MKRRTPPTNLSTDDLRDENFGSELGRLFFDSPDFNLKPTINHLKKIERLNIESHSIDAPADQSSIWHIRFEYHGFHFFVDTNHHGATSLFFVTEVNCPNDILLDLLRIFGQIGSLTWQQA